MVHPYDVIAWIFIKLKVSFMAVPLQLGDDLSWQEHHYGWERDGEIMVNVILVYHLNTLEISVEVNKEI
jgi:hypothetical protein